MYGIEFVWMNAYYKVLDQAAQCIVTLFKNQLIPSLSERLQGNF